MILLTPYAIENPIEVSPEYYEQLVHLKVNGWSFCESKEEYLAKLHYLRQGFSQGKIDETAFLEKEKVLVCNYWNKDI